MKKKKKNSIGRRSMCRKLKREKYKVSIEYEIGIGT